MEEFVQTPQLTTENVVPNYPTSTQYTIESILSMLPLPNGEMLNDEQISALMNLSFGENNYMLSMSRRPLLYEIMNTLSKFGFDITYNYLSSTSFANANEVILRGPAMSKTGDMALFDLNNYRMKQITSKGIHKCKSCGSKETISSEKQTRSADEPTTVKVECIHCGKKWVA
ncbi:Transcription factor S-II (TFIIS) [compost metagenome]